MTTIKNVNGPHCYYRLKKDEKDIYIFFDTHKELHNQTKCSNEEENIDIDNLLEIFVKNNKEKVVDFLLEKVNIPFYYNNENYFVKLSIMFEKLYDLQQKSNKENINNYLRLHYTDIRNFTNIFNSHECDNILDNFIIDHNISKIVNMYFDLIINFSLLYKIISDIKKIKDEKTNKIVEKFLVNNEKTVEPTFIKALNKIFLEKNYNDKKNYKIIDEFANEYIIKKLQYVLLELHENIYIFNNYFIEQKKYKNSTNKIAKIYGNKTFQKYILINPPTDDLNKKIKIITDKTVQIFSIISDIDCFIMDIYFLRRFLDKNYINNAISYSGGFHSTNYVWFLVKYCDFEIIEFSENNLNKNEIIKQIKNNDFYGVFNFIYKNSGNQCVKLKYPFFN